MRFASVIVLSLIGLFPVLASADAADEIKKLEGIWNVARAEKDGEALPDEEAKAMKVTIKDGKIIIADGKNKDVATLKLDPSKKPATIDFVPAEGKAVAPGIYTFERDKLKICWTKSGGERPKEFASKGDSEIHLLILTKAK